MHRQLGINQLAHERSCTTYRNSTLKLYITLAVANTAHYFIIITIYSLILF